MKPKRLVVVRYRQDRGRWEMDAWLPPGSTPPRIRRLFETEEEATMAAAEIASPIRDRIHAGTGIDVRPAWASATRTDSGRTSRPTRRRTRREAALRSSAAMAARQAKAIVRPATVRRVLRFAIPEHLADHVLGIDPGCEQLFPDLVRHVHQGFSTPVPGVIQDAIAGEA